jgi:hypothetical protein
MALCAVTPSAGPSRLAQNGQAQRGVRLVASRQRRAEESVSTNARAERRPNGRFPVHDHHAGLGRGLCERNGVAREQSP